VGLGRDVGIVDGLIGVLPGESACGETLLLLLMEGERESGVDAVRMS
jgi:hypothetical protein